MQGVLRFAPGVAEHIVELCDRKPYAIQKLCLAVVQNAHAQGRYKVRLEDLETILEMSDESGISDPALQIPRG